MGGGIMTLYIDEATLKLFCFIIIIMLLIIWRWSMLNLFAWVLDDFEIKGSIRKNHKILYFISWLYLGWKIADAFIAVYIDEVGLQ